MNLTQTDRETLVILRGAIKRINEIAKAKADTLGFLYDRWQDEKQYEDFKDYIEAAKKRLEDCPDFTFERMTQRPFEIHGKIEHFPVSIRINSKCIQAVYPKIPKGI